MEEQSRIHPWVYFISPIRKDNFIAREVLLFSAFCKACRTYFTETIPYLEGGGQLMSPSTLPRYGCNPISEDVALLG